MFECWFQKEEFMLGIKARQRLKLLVPQTVTDACCLVWSEACIVRQDQWGQLCSSFLLLISVTFSPLLCGHLVGWPLLGSTVGSTTWLVLANQNRKLRGSCLVWVLDSGRSSCQEEDIPLSSPGEQQLQCSIGLKLWQPPANLWWQVIWMQINLYYVMSLRLRGCLLPQRKLADPDWYMAAKFELS